MENNVGFKWKDDLIFKCYEINHALQSADFHKAKYGAVKAAAREVGIDCMVDANLIPIFSGFTLIKGYVDVCHFEWQAVREYEPTRRPMGLPPKARSGYITRLATAISKENYSMVSLYVPHDLRGPEFNDNPAPASAIQPHVDAVRTIELHLVGVSSCEEQFHLLAGVSQPIFHNLFDYTLFPGTHLGFSVSVNNAVT